MNTEDANKDRESDAVSTNEGAEAAGPGQAILKDVDASDMEDSVAKPDRPAQSLQSRFVKSKTVVDDVKKDAVEISRKPAYIDDAARVLLLEPDEKLTVQSVHAAWRRLICLPDVHPDLGGNAERAILINLAKDQLIRWIESNQPKLGKLFQR